MLLLGLLVACSGGRDDDDPELEGDDAGECDDGADNDADGSFDCDDTDCAGAPDCATTDDTATDDTGEGICPVITSFTAGPHEGLVDYEDGQYPAVSLQVSIEDADAEAGASAHAWWDETVDGSVSTLDDALSWADLTASDGYDLLIVMTGDSLAFQTEYEFAVQFVDASGCASDVAIAAGSTPDAEGNP